MECEVLVFKQRYGVAQLEAFSKWRYERLAGEIEPPVDVVGTVGLEECKLESVSIVWKAIDGMPTNAHGFVLQLSVKEISSQQAWEWSRQRRHEDTLRVARYLVTHTFEHIVHDT